MRFFSKSERLEIENILLYYIKTANDLPRNENKGVKIMETFITHGIDKPSYFSDPINKKIFKILLTMHERNLLINTDFFQRFLEKNKTLERDDKNKIFERFLFNKINEHYSPLYFEHYMYTFKEHLIMDYWNFILDKQNENIWNTDDVLENSFGIVDGFKNLWDKLTVNVRQEDNSNIKDELIEKIKNLENGISTSVKTGLINFDEFTGGFENTELNLIAARPSMGKTTLAIALAKRFMFNSKIVHFFTLEMTRKQIINKFVADDLGIDYKNIKRGNLTKDQLEEVLLSYDLYDNHPYLIVDELPEQSLSSFYRAVKSVKADIRIFDYLQLMYLDGEIKKKAGNREQEVSEISKAFKRIAKEINNPIIALCQLSRAVESRANKRPQLSDLRESGSLEQDADNIYFVYREAYYQMQAGVPVSLDKQGNVELILAKGREIGICDFELWLDLKKNTVQEGFKV